MKKTLSFIYFFLCACLLFSVTAAAYIDPSAMTYIIQIVAGMAIAAGAAFGFYYRKIKRFFSKLFDKSNKVNDNWDYDADDDDDYGMGDYPVLDCDRYADDEAEIEYRPVNISIDELFASLYDKYDERGIDLSRENAELRKLLSQEMGKRQAMAARTAQPSDRT